MRGGIASTPNVHPGDFVVLDQLVDRTWGRPDTYYDAGHRASRRRSPIRTARSSRAHAVDGRRARRRDACTSAGRSWSIHGPRFSTRAESRWYRSQGWDVVNMTQYPEAYLARELGMHYAGIALITDYDTGVEHDPDVDAGHPGAGVRVLRGEPAPRARAAARPDPDAARASPSGAPAPTRSVPSSPTSASTARAFDSALPSRGSPIGSPLLPARFPEPQLRSEGSAMRRSPRVLARVARRARRRAHHRAGRRRRSRDAAPARGVARPQTRRGRRDPRSRARRRRSPPATSAARRATAATVAAARRSRAPSSRGRPGRDRAGAARTRSLFTGHVAPRAIAPASTRSSRSATARCTSRPKTASSRRSARRRRARDVRPDRGRGRRAGRRGGRRRERRAGARRRRRRRRRATATRSTAGVTLLVTETEARAIAFAAATADLTLAVDAARVGVLRRTGPVTAGYIRRRDQHRDLRLRRRHLEPAVRRHRRRSRKPRATRRARCCSCCSARRTTSASRAARSPTRSPTTPTPPRPRARSTDEPDWHLLEKGQIDIATYFTRLVGEGARRARAARSTWTRTAGSGARARPACTGWSCTRSAS